MQTIQRLNVMSCALTAAYISYLKMEKYIFKEFY